MRNLEFNFPSLRDYLEVGKALKAMGAAVRIDPIIEALNAEGWRVVRFADAGGIVPVLHNGNQLREVSVELIPLHDEDA